MARAHKVTPFLWFDSQAEEAMTFYVSLFPDARVISVNRVDGPEGKQVALVATFELAGQRLIAMNAGPRFKLDEAFSLFVECEDQAEVDRLWEALIADGGAPSQCGWLKDRFGLSWQIIPRALMQLMSDPDPARAQRVTAAMLTMSKIDVAALEAAHRGDGPLPAR
jgi:predicted 3-demethylubiquinone-9 3-methyltransferase (glyoxalase superfamily)